MRGWLSGNNISFSVKNLIQIHLVRLQRFCDFSESYFPILQTRMLRISVMEWSDWLITWHITEKKVPESYYSMQRKKRKINTFKTECYLEHFLSHSGINSAQFSHSVGFNSLQPHGLQHARLSCPSQTPEAYSNSCPLHQWCHPTISSSAILSPPTFNLSQHQGLFQWVDSSHRWPEYWSFSFSICPKEFSFRTDRLVGSPCSPRASQESSSTPRFKSINSSALSFLPSPTLTSIHDHWKNHSLDQMDLCRQVSVSAF